MKRLFKSGLSIALASVLFVSCSSDDNSSDGGNGGGPNPTENIGQTVKKGQTLTLEKIKNTTYQQN